MRDNIVISENNMMVESYDQVGDSELIIFTEQIKAFRLGQQYWFRIHVGPTKTTGESINDIELVEWKKFDGEIFPP